MEITNPQGNIKISSIIGSGSPKIAVSTKNSANKIKGK
jgi:hypothetical protein